MANSKEEKYLIFTAQTMCDYHIMRLRHLLKDQRVPFDIAVASEREALKQSVLFFNYMRGYEDHVLVGWDSAIIELRANGVLRDYS